MKADGPLNSYLLDVRARLQKARREQDESSRINITLVLGNEAADLDSIVSSLTYAFLLNHQAPESFFVPVINIPRADLPLRPEVLHVLSKCCVPHSSLIFIDDQELKNCESFVDAIILVDHNRMATEQQKAFGDKVVGILDHHADEGEYQNVKLRIVETVGSATSLVALEWKKFCGSTEPPFSIHTQVAYMLLAPILLDTVNLVLALGRTYPKDMEASSFLHDSILPNAQFDTTSYYNSICAARCDITSMCDRDLLRKDYKEWTITVANAGKESPVDGQKAISDQHRVGISSVGWRFDHWAESSARAAQAANTNGHETSQFRRGDLSPIADSMVDFFLERKLTLLIVMLALDRGAPDGFVRELAIYYPVDGPDYDCLINALATDVGDLDLSRIGGKSDGKDADCIFAPPAKLENAERGRVRFYRQRNIRISRKVLWPVIRKMLEVGNGKSNL